MICLTLEVCRHRLHLGFRLGTRGIGRRGRRGLGRRHLHFFAGVARRLHAPLALVLNPLSSVSRSSSVAGTIGRGLTIVRRDTIELGRLVARVLRFEGARASGHRLHMIGTGIISTIRRISLGCRRLTRGPSMTVGFITPRGPVVVCVSGRIVTVVLSGLMSGTVGCASRNGVSVDIRHHHDKRHRLMSVAIDSANRNVSTGTLPRVFSHCCRRGKPRRTSNANVNLSLIGGLIALRRNRIGMRDGLRRNADFVIALSRGRVCPSTLQNSRGTSTGLRNGSTTSSILGSRRTILDIRGNGLLLLIMRSGERVLSCITRSFVSRFSILGTNSNQRKLTLTLSGIPSMVVSSIVVPGVSNGTVYETLGGSVHADRVPVVLLATGSSFRTGRGNCSSNTSSCVAGPFARSLLHDQVLGLLRRHQHSGVLVRRSGRAGLTRGGRRLERSLGGVSRRFFSGLGGLVRRGVDNSISIGLVTDGLTMDADALCHGVGTLANVSAGRCVHGCGVRCTRRLLLRNGCDVDRVSFVMNVGDITCFHQYFGTRCKRVPSRCLGGLRGVWC